MASNSTGKHRIDHDIEKYRLELNWTKILDRLKASKTYDYGRFLEGESQLELYLQQYPLIESDHSLNPNDEEHLNRIENLLKSNQSFQSRCLLAKLFYLKCQDEQSLFYVDSVLNSIPKETEEQPNRTSILLAEIYSLKGILLEKKQKNNLDAIKAFDDSCRLSQIYYTAMEKAKHLNNENLDIENSLIKIAYQRLPLLHASNKNFSRAIEIFRSSIENIHIKSFETIRQTLIKQYAQLLIKCVCPSNYHKIDSLQHQQRSESIFIPQNIDEEICLLLLLGQNSILSEAVLDLQPEHEKQRECSHQSAYRLLSLLAIFFARKRAFHLISDSYEQALRFSFEHFQTWYNYGLSLISSGQSFRAYLVLKECLRMQPKNVQVYLMLTKIILEDIYDFSAIFQQNPSSVDDLRSLAKFYRLDNQQLIENHAQAEQRPPLLQLIDEAIDYCEKAKILSNPPSARAMLLLGLSKSFKARQTSIHQARISLFNSAIDNFRQSIEIDPYDSIVHFHLAQNLAFINQTDDAMKSIDQCLALTPDDRDALHLRSILLTAQKKFAQAYQQIYRVTTQYENISLLLTKASIEEELYGYQQSILTCEEALILWKKNFQAILVDNQDRKKLHAKNGTTSRLKSISKFFDTDIDQSAKSSSTSKPDDQSKNSFINHLRLLIGYFDDDQLYSYHRTFDRSISISSIYLQFFQIFEYLIRYYIELNQIDQSEDCLKLFSTIDSSSHQFYYFRGLIVNARRQYSLAKQFFNDALAINPNHFPTLIQLTKLLIEFGNYSLAEKYARDAIALQPSNHQPWYLLSLSMEARGEYQQSIDVSATAVQLEEDSPIISYNSIVRVL